jgi:hypothetical protein
VLGGILIPTIMLMAFKWRSARARRLFEEKTFAISRDKWRAPLAVGLGQRARRPDARRDLHAMGAQDHAAAIVAAIIAPRRWCCCR